MVEANGQQNDQSQGWQKADARVLGQILAAQNVIFTLPDAIRIAEFYAQTLLTIPGIIGCRVCLGNQSIQAGEIQSSACDECQATSGIGKKEHELIPADSDFQCALTSQPDIQVIPIDSDQHHFGFFVSKINNAAAFDVYDPFIRNLSKYVAVTLENRLQKDWLQKARDELEHKVEERTHALLVANEELDAARLAALEIMQEAVEARQRAEQVNVELQREVAERQWAEAALQASEIKYRIVADNTYDWEFWVDPQGQFLYSSPSCERITGYKPANFEADPTLLHRIIHPEDRSQYERHQREAFHEHLEPEQEFRIIRPDGSQRWLGHVCGPVYDEIGRFLGVRGSNRDITERKQTEEALRASERKLGEAAQIAHVGYWERDYLAGTINLSHEACQIFGLPPEKSFPRLEEWHEQWQKLIHPDDQPKVMQVLTDALAGGPPYNVDYRVIRSDGRVRYIHSYAELRRDETGKPLRMFGTMIDITDRKQAEEALRESEARFRAVFESSVDAIGVSKGGVHIFVNPAYLALFGYTDNSELGGKSILDLIAPSHRAQVLENVGRRASGEPAPIVYETRGLRKDGSEFDMDVHVSTYELHGELYTVPIVRDITERKQITEALAAREREFRTLAENSPDNIARYDVNCRTIYVNPALEKTLGRSSHEMIGTTPVEMGVIAEVRRYQEKIAEVLKTGKDDELDLVLPDKGEGVRYHNIRFVAERGADGTIMGVQVIGRDITERKRTEEALKESEQRYRMVFEDSPVSIWEEDFSQVKAYFDELRASGITNFRAYFESHPQAVAHCAELIKVLNVNQATLTLLEAQDKQMLLAGLPTVLADTKLKAFREEMITMAEGGQNFESDEEIHRTLTGNQKLVTIRTSVAPGYEHSLGKVLVSLVDVTERKRAEEEIRELNQGLEQRVVERTIQLESANKELEAFAYSVSHDLRAPLRHIDGFIEMLKNRTQTILDDQSRHYMDVIAESAKKMGTLIDDLLSFSRTGRNEMFKSQVNLNELIQEILREVQPEIGSRNVQWEIASLPIVSGDRAMLHIVLINLISNALKFTRPRNPAGIEIGYERQESEAVIFVRDNGVGFDMNYADRLFGVFQRLHRADEFEGTGIGLANVRRIIERHGGRTWAEGELDRGATFYFSLPNKMFEGRR